MKNQYEPAGDDFQRTVNSINLFHYSRDPSATHENNTLDTRPKPASS